MELILTHIYPYIYSPFVPLQYNKTRKLNSAFPFVTSSLCQRGKLMSRPPLNSSVAARNATNKSLEMLRKDLIIMINLLLYSQRCFSLYKLFIGNGSCFTIINDSDFI